MSSVDGIIGKVNNHQNNTVIYNIQIQQVETKTQKFLKYMRCILIAILVLAIAAIFVAEIALVILALHASLISYMSFGLISLCFVGILIVPYDNRHDENTSPRASVYGEY